jgi:NitT/TauT family transport system substrate-binding protein
MKLLLRGRTVRLAVVLAAVAALAVSAAMATAAPAADAAKQDNTLVVGYPGIPPIFMAVRLYVADRMGYYRKYGVNVQLKGFTTGTDAVRAVQAGQIDAAWSPTPFAMTLISKGVPLVGIEGMDKVDWVVGSNSSSVRTCSQLKGQNVGVDSIGGARYQALQAMLTRCKLTIQDVHPIVFPGNTAIQAMLAGQLHVAVLHIDDLAEASAQGGTPVRTIVSIAQTDPFQHYDLLVTTRANLAAKRALFVKLLKGDIQATRYMYKRRALNKVADIATVTGHSLAVAKSALRQYLVMKWWPLNKSGLGRAGITRTIYEQVQLGNISNGNPPTWKDIVNAGPWNAAYKAVTPRKRHRR